MDRVATEVTQKVSVLLQNQNLDSGTCQQVPQHHPGGATAHDAACYRRREDGFHLSFSWARRKLYHPPRVTGTPSSGETASGGRRTQYSAVEKRHFRHRLLGRYLNREILNQSVAGAVGGG